MTDHIATLEKLDRRCIEGTPTSNALRAAIALMRGQSDADKVLRAVWSILGPLPTPICAGCATEQTMALETMRDYFGSNDYPAKPKDSADEQ